MTLAKRLQEADAMDIFSSVANNEPPPQRLDFKIVRVTKHGLKLAPPSLDFDYGLYVLLRAPTEVSEARVPSEFSDRVLTEHDLAGFRELTWSLSGPQQSNNTNFRQRYCYPRKEQQHSGKGAAIWTQIDGKGEEDIDCRIFHVYYSSKRARTPSPKRQSIAKRSISNVALTRDLKRKKNGGALENKKKHKAETESPGPSLEEDMQKSPQTKVSFEMDSNLAFNSHNLFDPAALALTGQSFSPFVPVQTNVDKMVLHKPAFNSTATVPTYAAPDGYYYGYYAPCHPHAYEGRHGHTDCAAFGTPSILTLTDFSKRLQGIEASIKRDVHGSTGANQALKLQLLQKWAKAIAEKPLQSAKVLAPKENSKDAKGSPGTPSITP